jgi:squalene-hopene/tetraprenyl-beta-curcumene cyclase
MLDSSSSDSAARIGHAIDVSTALEQSLARSRAVAARWRRRVLLPDADTYGTKWLASVPDVGPACEAILADQLFYDLDLEERDGLLAWIRGSQDASGAWLDANGEPDLSLTVLGWWARVTAGDDRRSESMIRAVRVVHALGGAQRGNFQVRLWLAMSGQIPWAFLPAIPGELFLLPASTWLSPARFSPWARAVLTAYYVIARGPARLQLPDASELLLHRGGAAMIAPRLTRPGLAGDLLQAFDRTVKLSRKLPRGPLPRWALERAASRLDHTQQDHGGWFSVRPTILSLIALRVVGASSDDPRIERGLAYLRRARGLARIRTGAAAGDVALAQGLGGPPLSTVARLVLADPDPTDVGKLLRLELSDAGPWQARADAPAGGWPIEAGAQHHLDLEATCHVLEALTTVPADSSQTSPAWATTRRATDVILAMQEGRGGFARFERGEADVVMRQFPWTDADLLAYGQPGDPAHVRVSAHAIGQLGQTGFRIDDDRIARGIAWLSAMSADEHRDRSIDTLAALAKAVSTTCPSDHPLRGEVERRLRARQREDGSFGNLVETSHALIGLLDLIGEPCVQVRRAAAHLAGAVRRLGDDLEHEGTTSQQGFGLSADTHDPSAGAREVSQALAAFARKAGGTL